jgi:hypothetical protein
MRLQSLLLTSVGVLSSLAAADTECVFSGTTFYAVNGAVKCCDYVLGSATKASLLVYCTMKDDAVPRFKACARRYYPISISCESVDDPTPSNAKS